jgi:glycine/D-amino acid oxidase-like deaminating enzyme
VFACGAWLPKLFARLLGPRIFPTRQESLLFWHTRGRRALRRRRAAGLGGLQRRRHLLWNAGSRKSRLQGGARQARPGHRSGSRRPRGLTGALADARAYLAKRFPALAGAPLNEERVCQYENSSNGDLLIDRHPTADNVLLVGAGSGHGFKHGPEVGRYAAELLTGKLKKLEPRFSLESKAEQQNRAVH